MASNFQRNLSFQWQRRELSFEAPSLATEGGSRSLLSNMEINEKTSDAPDTDPLQ